MRTNNAAFVAALAGLAVAAAANGQVVINEVYPNPPGSSSIDNRWEYIEVYGPAGMDLTGYLIASVFGGADGNSNNVPGPLPAGWDAGDEVSEIDEAWTLDGLHIGGNGLLVIYNSLGSSFIPGLASPGTALATFTAAHCPTSDTAGRIKNDGSASFILVRKRPFHAINASGISVYDGVPGSTIVSGPATYPTSIRYAWRKDVNPDVNYDGLLDFAGFGTLAVGGGPNPPEPSVNSERAATPAVGAPWQMEPYQMVDDVAWSNGGGKEYTRSKQQEISDTAGFNPDAISRLAYYGANPHRGSTFIGGVMSDSRMADEEWVYGDIVDSAPLTSYMAGFVGGPTDQNGPTYNDQGQLDAAGTRKLNDINLTGFKLTPGGFNDVNAAASGGINNVQFRFVRGDFNFDGVVDCQDRELMLARMSAGASLDDTQAKVAERGTPDDTSDDVAYTGWKWQGREFNGLLAMVRMSLTDGTTGEWNSGMTVTAADLAAFDAVFTGSCCIADIGAQGGLPGHDGALDNNDFVVFIDYFFNHNPLADVGRQGGIAPGDGAWDNNDFVVFIDAFFAGCH
jgi:hypothetical protein